MAYCWSEIDIPIRQPRIRPVKPVLMAAIVHLVEGNKFSGNNLTTASEDIGERALPQKDLGANWPSGTRATGNGDALDCFYADSNPDSISRVAFPRPWDSLICPSLSLAEDLLYDRSPIEIVHWAHRSGIARHCTALHSNSFLPSRESLLESSTRTDYAKRLTLTVRSEWRANIISMQEDHFTIALISFYSHKPIVYCGWVGLFFNLSLSL